MEQTTLAITGSLTTEQEISLRPEQRKRLVELMAEALLAVRGACEHGAEEEHGDDASHE